MANNFKDKIRDISNDNTINVGYFTCTAYVSEASEVSNTCTITYIDSNGNQRTQKNIPVKINAQYGLIEWFPNNGDYVTLEVKNVVCQIISPSVDNYFKQLRHSRDTNNNILTTYYNYTLGGTIF